MGETAGTAPSSTALVTLAGGFVCDRLILRDPRWWAWLPALSTLVATPLLALVLLWPDGGEAVWWALPAGIGAMAEPAVYAVVQNLAPQRLPALATSILILNTTLIGMGAGPWAVGIGSVLMHADFGAEALRYALLAGLATNPIGAIFFWRAARTLRGDLRVAAAV